MSKSFGRHSRKRSSWRERKAKFGSKMSFFFVFIVIIIINNSVRVVVRKWREKKEAAERQQDHLLSSTLPYWHCIGCFALYKHILPVSQTLSCSLSLLLWLLLLYNATRARHYDTTLLSSLLFFIRKRRARLSVTTPMECPSLLWWGGRGRLCERIMS